MNRLIFVLLLIYNFNYGKKIEVYYITTDNEKHYIVLDIPVDLLSDEINFQAIQFTLKYYDKNGDKQKLYLELIYEVGLNYYGEKIVLRKLINSIDLVPMALFDTRHILLKLVKEDVVSSYSFYGTWYTVTQGGFGLAGSGSFYNYGVLILVKKDGTMVDSSTGSFKNKIRKFFSDCPELVEKINDKIFKRKHIEEVIEYYKLNCFKE